MPPRPRRQEISAHILVLLSLLLGITPGWVSLFFLNPVPSIWLTKSSHVLLTHIISDCSQPQFFITNTTARRREVFCYWKFYFPLLETAEHWSPGRAKRHPGNSPLCPGDLDAPTGARSEPASCLTT